MKFMYALGIFITSYALYKYRNTKNRNLLIISSNTKLAKFYKIIGENFLEQYTPSLILYSGHAQTLILELFHKLLQLLKRFFDFYKFKYRREIFTTKDLSTMAIDHAININSECRPKKILIVVPGFTSNSEEYYIKGFIEDFVDEFDCRIVNIKGFGGQKLTSHTMISPHCFRDVGEYIEYICYNNPDKAVFVCGFSYGGMLVARFFGSTKQLPRNLLGGCGICYPVCVKAVSEYVENTLEGFYSRYSASNLKEVFFENIEKIFENNKLKEEKEKIIEQVKKAKFVSDFEKAFIYKMLDFSSIDDYYEDCKLDKHVSKINVPFLSIFTEDDPVIPFHAINLKEYQMNKNLVTVISKKGGHLGFFSGVIPQRWINLPIKSFIRTIEVMNEVDEIHDY